MESQVTAQHNTFSKKSGSRSAGSARFGPGSRSGFISQRYGSGSGSGTFLFLTKVLRRVQFFDKMDPPRPLMVAKFNSKKQPFRPHLALKNDFQWQLTWRARAWTSPTFSTWSTTTCRTTSRTTCTGLAEQGVARRWASPPPWSTARRVFLKGTVASERVFLKGKVSSRRVFLKGTVSWDGFFRPLHPIHDRKKGA